MIQNQMEKTLIHTILIVMSSGKAVQSKDDGEFREEEVYSRKRNLGQLP